MAGSPARGQEAGLRGKLGQAVGRLVEQAQLGSGPWAIRIVELPSRAVVYEHASDMALVPASNMKLATTAAAVDVLGAEFHFETVLARRGDDLVVIGGGDPLVGDTLVAEMNETDPDQIFLDWAKALKEGGLIHFAGDLVVDDFIFDSQTVHPNWPKDQLNRWYEAPVGGLNFNNNCLDIWLWPTSPGKPAGYRIRPETEFVQIVNACVSGPGKKGNGLIINRKLGANEIRLAGQCAAKSTEPQNVTIHDPGMFFATYMKESLAKQGIQVAGRIRREAVRKPDGVLPSDVTTLAVYRTPLEKVLWRCNTRSLNMAADCLIKRLGAQAAGQGSWKSGAHVVGDYLTRIGVPDGGVEIDDGSGMSRNNKVTAQAMTQILVHVFEQPYREMFMGSLAVAGETGTLARKFKNGQARGKILGKTGTLKGVRSLCGYARPTDETWLAFAMLFNDMGKKSGRAMQLEQQLCELMARFPSVDLPTTAVGTGGAKTRSQTKTGKRAK